MQLELTPKDRIFLASQLRILEKLYPDESDGYARWREAVEGGYSLHYDDGAPWLGEELSPDDCREVLNILEMYSQLQYGYQRLEDKAGIDPDGLTFFGFDGNIEGGYLAYADYFINKLGRYQELKHSGDRLNSHMPLLGAYRRMLEVWREVRERAAFGEGLNKDEIEAILAARIHPSNRVAEQVF